MRYQVDFPVSIVTPVHAQRVIRCKSHTSASAMTAVEFYANLAWNFATLAIFCLNPCTGLGNLDGGRIGESGALTHHVNAYRA